MIKAVNAKAPPACKHTFKRRYIRERVDHGWLSDVGANFGKRQSMQFVIDICTKCQHESYVDLIPLTERSKGHATT